MHALVWLVNGKKDPVSLLLDWAWEHSKLNDIVLYLETVAEDLITEQSFD